MNHLEFAKEIYEANKRDAFYDMRDLAVIAHALISIAESLEKIARTKNEAYEAGYQAGMENLEAEIERALDREDK